MSYASFLKEIELFQDLTEEELSSVSQALTEVAYAPGAVIIEEGTPGDSLYLIRSGKVTVERSLGEESVLLAELGPGQAFGEMSLIDNFPHSARVSALENTEVLMMSRLDLEVTLNWDTVLASKLWRSFSRIFCNRLRQTNEELLNRAAVESPGDRTIKSREAYALVQGIGAEPSPSDS